LIEYQAITDSQLAVFSKSPTDNYESIASALALVFENTIEGIFLIEKKNYR
jgi:hypothetical protein